jgi:hypothetical protein
MGVETGFFCTSNENECFNQMKITRQLQNSFFAVCVMACATVIQAQNFTGFKGGLNYALTDIGVGKAALEVEQIVNEQRSNDGWHLGVFHRRYFFDRSHFIQFEMMGNHSSFTLLGPNDYAYQLRQTAGELNGIFGFELLRFIRLQGGVSSRYVVNPSYQEIFEPFRWGYVLGTGFTLGKFNADISYNAAFLGVEGHFQTVPLRYQHSQVMLNIGLMF